MPMSDQERIIVAGAGPVGLAAALALGRAGLPVHLVGPDMGSTDARTTALMAPSLDYLASLGIDTGFGGNAAPLSVMRIIDGTRRLLRSPTVTFRASELGLDAFGTNIPNAVLNRALGEAVAALPNVERYPVAVASWTLRPDRADAHLADGRTLSAGLVVAADGKDSPAREAAGIASVGHPYPQSALVLSFEHSRPHGNTSNEFHTESGPFTQVPLPGSRSSLVWVVSPKEAEALLALDDEALARRIEERMDSMLGAVTLRPGRQTYPLSARMPVRFARNRIALVGEAAHLIPPIGAQGLNLGLRDVEALARIALAHPMDPGAEAALEAYDGARRQDILARNAGVNLLNRSLLSPFLPAQVARSAGLSLLDWFAPLRGFFMREGMAPGTGLKAFSRTDRSATARH